MVADESVLTTSMIDALYHEATAAYASPSSPQAPPDLSNEVIDAMYSTVTFGVHQTLNMASCDADADLTSSVPLYSESEQQGLGEAALAVAVEQDTRGETVLASTTQSQEAVLAALAAEVRVNQRLGESSYMELMSLSHQVHVGLSRRDGQDQ